MIIIVEIFHVDNNQASGSIVQNTCDKIDKGKRLLHPLSHSFGQGERPSNWPIVISLSLVTLLLRSGPSVSSLWAVTTFTAETACPDISMSGEPLIDQVVLSSYWSSAGSRRAM